LGSFSWTFLIYDECLKRPEAVVGREHDDGVSTGWRMRYPKGCHERDCKANRKRGGPPCVGKALAQQEADERCEQVANVHRLGKRTVRNGEKQNATRPERRHQERVSRVVGKRAQNTDRDGASGTGE
jgi:hypothetical protein